MNLERESSPGMLLKSARESKGLKLQDIAHRTRIPVTSLEALEADDWGRLPGAVYVRGFIRAYAGEVDLNPETVLRSAPTDEQRTPSRRSRHVHTEPITGHAPKKKYRHATGWALGAIVTVVFFLWLTQDTVKGTSSDEIEFVESSETPKE